MTSEQAFELDGRAAREFVDRMAPLFEGAPGFLWRLDAARPFGSWERLFERAREIAQALPEPLQIELVDAHPRLGAPPASVSAMSFREQGYELDAAENLVSEAARERDGVAAELSRLNAEYEARFGFRYCVFVAGRPRSELIPEMAAALGRERELELHRALDAVVDIAIDRLARDHRVTFGGTVYELGDNRYGKSRIRLVTVRRGPDQHHLRDLTVAVALEGDFDAVHTQGDNAGVIATDTMKNTVYAFARDRLTGSPEAFGLELARHFAGYAVCSRAMVDLVEHPWRRVATGDGEAPDAFVRSGQHSRLASVTVDRSGVAEVIAGIDDMTVMKTTKSAFTGFDRDRYTTLPEVDDRLMATKVRATWGYRADLVAGSTLDFDATWKHATQVLMASLAEHFSPSVQASIWIMGGAMMDAEPSIDWVRMVLPNLHHWKVDLGPFGLDNPGEVFVSTTEPHGLIDATVRRQPR